MTFLERQNIAKMSTNDELPLHLNDNDLDVKYPNYRTTKIASNGFLNLYESDLKKVQTDLDFLLSKQKSLENDLAREKNNYTTENLHKMLEMAETIKVYKEKLVNIKKQMTVIHQKTRNLKKRTTDLLEFKEKEVATKLQKRQQEESLVANSSLAANNKMASSPQQGAAK